MSTSATETADGLPDSSDYARALYAAGWPKDVRPYQARHNVALELGERGIDLGAVQGLAATPTGEHDAQA